MNSIDTAAQLAKLKEIIFNSPEAEHAKIDFIREELSTGRYRINSKLIADKMLEFTPVAKTTKTEVELA